MKTRLFAYVYLDTPIHNLSGLTKIISFLLLSFGVMFSYDIRYIGFVLIFSAVVFKISKLKFKQIRLMILYVGIFLLINAVFTFLFAPKYGVEIYGTEHPIIGLFGNYVLTWEQLLYQGTKMAKYAAVIPLGIIFFLTTDPSEFSASLNGIGISYKVAYPVALTLRYFPDIQRNYHEISLAQQARGLELSNKQKLGKRMKNAVLIIIPLIFSSVERIDSISNAMDLRGFGKAKRRTWYSKVALKRPDYLTLLISALIFGSSVMISVWLNGSRFYNPFV